MIALATLVVGVLSYVALTPKHIANRIVTTTPSTQVEPAEPLPVTPLPPIPTFIYTARTKMLSGVSITDTDDNDYNIDVYKIGDITGGQYKGGQLVSAYVEFQGPCKGSAACGKPSRQRFILFNKSAIGLLKNSESAFSFGPAADTGTAPLILNPFQKLGYTFTVDSTYSIPELEYPPTLTGSNPRQILQYIGERDGQLDLAKLVKVSFNGVSRDIYTTKPGLGSSWDFYGGTRETNSIPDPDYCASTDCFLTNSFYLFRPDGTFLEYYYKPDVSVSDALGSSSARYTYEPTNGCNGCVLDDVSVIPDDVVHGGADLTVIGHTPQNDPVYTLTDQNNELLKDFYQTYKQTYTQISSYGDVPTAPDNTGTAYTSLQSYEQFVSAHPILLWRDPFDRIIGFSNTAYLSPLIAEPIIYLYPQQEQTVEITLGSNVHLTTTTPSYQKQWNVLAEPSGQITNSTDNKKYPYLFWEGWSNNFAISQEGFVVAKSNVPNFLSSTLPKLGLTTKETNDFMKVWVPKLSESPYYFVTFITPQDINKLAPLRISPQPETLIRVLMDYKPLQEPISVTPLKLPQSPLRAGFTVVEWGGVERGYK